MSTCDLPRSTACTACFTREASAPFSAGAGGGGGGMEAVMLSSKSPRDFWMCGRKETALTSA